MALSTTQYGYIIDPMVPFTDDKGKTIKDGFVRVFVAGSSTPVITYRNFDGAANQDLIELDNSGRTKTSVIGSKGLTYKVCVYDAFHSQESPILTVDKVSVIGANITAGAGATVVTGLDGLTTKPDGFVDASVVGTDGYVALDHTLVTDDLDTDAKVTAVEEDRYIPLLNEDVNDPDSKMTLGRLWQWVLGKIKSLPTTITAFRTGDVIPVDGPSGTAKMSKDDLLKETAENARNGMVIEKVYEHNGVSASNYVVSNTTAIRGVCAPFKANTFDKIKLKVQCANATTLAVSIMDTSFNVLKSKSVPVEGTNEPYDVMIDWGEVITMNSSFYLDVQVPFNTDNTFLNAGSEKNYNVCDNYTYHAYFYIKVSNNRFDSQFKSVNCEFLLSTSDVRIPNLVDVDPQRIDELAPVMNPPIIYTAVQDLNNVRNYGVNIYPDHCFNTETMPNVKNDGLDHKYIRSGFGKNPHTGASYVQANDYDEENLSIDFVGENKKVTIATKHISLKASVQNGKKAFVLVIGDSQGMYGGGKLGYANGDGTAFWMYAAKLFDMDKADGATSDVVFLGSEKFRSWSNVARNEMTYEYLGNERTIHAASESIGSWSINHFLHKANEYTFDGSKDANEVYTGSNPINPFYDYTRVNEFDIFSINKWLERFRTLDDDGNRLTWGDPRIGTLITESSLQFINVCKPTHVICMLGRNTVVSPNAYGAVCDEFITAVKRDCPSAKIAMCLQPDMPGTFNGSNYPEVLAPSEATTIYKLNERANQFAIMRAIYNQCKERENDNVFIVPVWFSQPTMYGWNLSAITDFTMENKEKYVVQGDDFHPSGEAQKAWAYQLYCWILHTMYIDSLNE